MKANKVYQLKVMLKNTKPPIWRRIQVPKDYTFWDLHVAIQDAMGWTDMHLHEFEVYNYRKRCIEFIGIPDEEFQSSKNTLPGWKVPLTRYFSSTNRRASYIYDFGDAWEHSIIMEKPIPCENGQVYPRCIAGRRRCPPEDCGGPWGYKELLEIIAKPEHERHEEIKEWLGGIINPNDFDAKSIVFDDPVKRLEYALEDWG
jgi:hypothetical protein